MASKPNQNMTVPKEMLGKKSTLKQPDHGPFYVFSGAMPIWRQSYKDSVNKIEPCVVTPVTDCVEHLPIEQCERLNIIARTEELDPVGNRLVIGAALTAAEPQRDLILEMYAPWGVREITSFAHLSADDINLKDFNQLIYPELIEPWAKMSDETAAQVEKIGGLRVRQQFARKAIDFIKSAAFERQFGKSMRQLLLNGAEEILQAFTPAIAFVTSELNASDTDIKLRLTNAGGKPTYDPRDSYMQWLLARPGVDQTQTQQAAPLTLQLPEGFNSSGLNLSKDDLIALLQAASENAARAAIAVTTPVVSE